MRSTKHATNLRILGPKAFPWKQHLVPCLQSTQRDCKRRGVDGDVDGGGNHLNYRAMYFANMRVNGSREFRINPTYILYTPLPQQQQAHYYSRPSAQPTDSVGRTQRTRTSHTSWTMNTKLLSHVNTLCILYTQTHEHKHISIIWKIAKGVLVVQTHIEAHHSIYSRARRVRTITQWRTAHIGHTTNTVLYNICKGGRSGSQHKRTH